MEGGERVAHGAFRASVQTMAMAMGGGGWESGEEKSECGDTRWSTNRDRSWEGIGDKETELVKWGDGGREGGGQMNWDSWDIRG